MTDQLIQLPVPAAPAGIAIPIAKAVPAPTEPLVLLTPGYMATLAAVEAQVKDAMVSDDTASQHAANLQVRLTDAESALDTQRLALKRPHLDFNTMVDNLARPVTARIIAAKQLISTKNSIYLQDKRIREARAERERLAEIARLEKIKADEAAETARVKAEQEAKWAAEALPAATNEIDAGDDELPTPEVVAPTAVEQRIAELVAAPVKPTAGPVGIRVKVTLVPFVENVNELPDVFVRKEANLQAIRAAFCLGYKDGQVLPVLKGCRFEVQRSTQSTGPVDF